MRLLICLVILSAICVQEVYLTNTEDLMRWYQSTLKGLYIVDKWSLSNRIGRHINKLEQWQILRKWWILRLYKHHSNVSDSMPTFGVYIILAYIDAPLIALALKLVVWASFNAEHLSIILSSSLSAASGSKISSASTNFTFSLYDSHSI